MIEPGDVVVITGIMAAGKSTVGQALAESLPRSVHLRGDVFRRMIVGGQAPMTPDTWDESERQLVLRYRLATQAAIGYAEAGFAVVYQDVMLGPVLSDVVDMLRRVPGRRFLVVLAPNPSEVLNREANRPKSGYGAWTPAQLDASLRDETPQLGLWLDTTDLTVEETVASIVTRLDEAEIETPARETEG